MTYCEFCGGQISYLPFTCKYCGGTFCKKHRLPENHDCSFELKHVPVIPTTPREKRRRYQDIVVEKPPSRAYAERESKARKKYLKREERQIERELRSYKRQRKIKSQDQGTKILFLLIILFSITSLFFYEIPEYIYFSLYGLLKEYMYHTFLTGLFVSSGGFFELFFLFIMIFILYFMVRNIERSFGTGFLIKLYVTCCLFTALFYILLRVSFIPAYNLEDRYAIYIGLAWGGILGLLSFSIFPIMNRKITALMYFIPIRMKGRAFLLMIVIFRLIPALLFSVNPDYGPIYILFYLPELGGILGAYIVYKHKFRLS